MFLKPSEIFYCQNSISSVFGRRSGYRRVDIGGTLDNLYYGRIEIKDFAKITVVKKDDKWYTVNNRRLWIFRHLERLGKCQEIEVDEGTSIPDRKFTTTNGGTHIKLVRTPGGFCHTKPSVIIELPRDTTSAQIETIYSNIATQSEDDSPDSITSVDTMPDLYEYDKANTIDEHVEDDKDKHVEDLVEDDKSNNVDDHGEDDKDKHVEDLVEDDKSNNVDDHGEDDKDKHVEDLAEDGDGNTVQDLHDKKVDTPACKKHLLDSDDDGPPRKVRKVE